MKLCIDTSYLYSQSVIHLFGSASTSIDDELTRGREKFSSVVGTPERLSEYPDTGESGDSYDVEIASVAKTGECVQKTLQLPTDGMVNGIPLNATRTGD